MLNRRANAAATSHRRRRRRRRTAAAVAAVAAVAAAAARRASTKSVELRQRRHSPLLARLRPLPPPPPPSVLGNEVAAATRTRGHKIAVARAAAAATTAATATTVTLKAVAAAMRLEPRAYERRTSERADERVVAAVGRPASKVSSSLFAPHTRESRRAFRAPGQHAARLQPQRHRRRRFSLLTSTKTAKIRCYGARPRTTTKKAHAQTLLASVDGCQIGCEASSVFFLSTLVPERRAFGEKERAKRRAL